MQRLEKINIYSEPLVSIVIPVYNGANYLAEAIDSALSQTHKNIEILVINDGSDDNNATENIAKSFGRKIRYYKKENGGVASALNLGIDKMKGDYFSWLSHDDLYHNRKIEKQIRKISNINKDNIIVACNSTQLLEGGLKRKLYINAKAFSYTDIFLATSSKVGLNGCSLLIPSSIIKKSGGFDEKLKYTQDYDLWYKLAKKNKFLLLEDNLVTQRVHKNQGSILKKNDMAIAADKMHSDFLRSISQERFNLFFKNNKNMKYFLDNYQNYKRKYYSKTSIAMIRPLLIFLKSNNKSLWYKLLLKEHYYIEDMLFGNIVANGNKAVYFKKNQTKISKTKILKLYKILTAFNIDEIYSINNSVDYERYKSCVFFRAINLARDVGLLLSFRMIIKKFSNIIKRFN